MKKIIMLAMLFVGCATEHKAKTIDLSLETKGQIGNKTLGLNDDKEMILQEEQAASDELRIQEAVNLKLQFELEQDSHTLKRCRMDLADPRLGGSGSMPAVDDIDGMKAPETIKEEIGLTDNGDLKVVKKGYFLDKLRIERSYEKSLRKMISTVGKHKEECEFKMGIARRAAGLPGTRFQGSGYQSNDGDWVQTDRHENNLDDAFEIVKAK